MQTLRHSVTIKISSLKMIPPQASTITSVINAVLITSTVFTAEVSLDTFASVVGLPVGSALKDAPTKY